MAFLTLNGIDVQVESAEMGLARFGEVSRSHAGQVRRYERGRHREWKFRSLPLQLADAEALRGLVEGRGVHWTFDANTNSDGGLVATKSANASVGGPGSLTGQGNYFAGTSGRTSEAEWPLPLSSEWTMLATLYRAGHNRHTFRSDGAGWAGSQTAPATVRNDTHPAKRILNYSGGTGVLRLQSWGFGSVAWVASKAYALGEWMIATAGNGTAYAYECTQGGTSGASAPTWGTTFDATTPDGSVIWTMRADSGGVFHCGDLAWLPYKVPDAWVQPLYTFLKANPWSPLPRLLAQGAFAPDGTAGVQVVGETGEGELLEFRSGGSLVVGERFEFVLREV